MYSTYLLLNICLTSLVSSHITSHPLGGASVERGIRQAREDIDLSLSRLLRRGSPCGAQNGISCPADQCCSINGDCGTGPSYCQAPDCQFAYGPACDANVVPTGTSTGSIPRPQLGSLLYGGVGILNCVVPGTVAMTYDDGPGPYTSALLDMLANAKAKATFFVTGNNNGKGEIDSASTPWPEVIRRMYREGHQIASHTWSHPALDNITSAQRVTEMVRNEMAFRNILGFFPTYMRPPYNSCQGPSGCMADIGNLGYHIIGYNVDTHDWQNQTPDLLPVSENFVTSAFANSNPQSQSFLAYAHDIHEQTVMALTPFIIQTVQSKGFKLVTVGECLNDPVSNWYRNPNTGAALTSVPALADSVSTTQPPATSNTSSSKSTTVPQITTTTTTTTSMTTTTTTTLTTTTTSTTTSTIPTTHTTSSPSPTPSLTTIAGTSLSTTQTPSTTRTSTTSRPTTSSSLSSSSSSPRTTTQASTAAAASSPTATTRPNSSSYKKVNIQLMGTLMLILLALFIIR